MTLARRTPLRRGGTITHRGHPLGRAPMPRSAAPERDWRDARRKVEREGACRVCGRRTEDLIPAGQRLEAAHLIGRDHDRPRPHPDVVGETSGPLWVNPLAVAPLCTGCHRDFDGRRLDVLPHLSLAEQAHAVSLVGLVAAYRRLTSNRNPEEEEPSC